MTETADVLTTAAEAEFLKRNSATPDMAAWQELHRFAEIGRLSASLLHDISNPLAAALLHLEQAARQQTADLTQVRHNIRLLQRYVEAARRQVRNQSQVRIFSVTSQLHQVRRMMRSTAQHAGVRLCFSTDGAARLHGDPVKFQHILANVIANAIHAYESPSTTARPEVRVTLQVRTSVLVISVQDWGQGMPPEVLCQIFEPFYSTKLNRGLGLGMHLVKRCVIDDFRGNITVQSTPNQGTTCTIRLPLSSLA
jgi:signal transduction histidine kinase